MSAGGEGWWWGTTPPPRHPTPATSNQLAELGRGAHRLEDLEVVLKLADQRGLLVGEEVRVGPDGAVVRFEHAAGQARICAPRRTGEQGREAGEEG